MGKSFNSIRYILFPSQLSIDVPFDSGEYNQEEAVFNSLNSSRIKYDESQSFLIHIIHRLWESQTPNCISFTTISIISLLNCWLLFLFQNLLTIHIFYKSLSNKHSLMNFFSLLSNTLRNPTSYESNLQFLVLLAKDGILNRLVYPISPIL